MDAGAKGARSLGRPDDAAQTYRAGIDKARRHLELNPDDVRALYLCGGAPVEYGSPDEGFEMVDRAVRAGYNHRAWMETDSDIDPVRRHPRFQALLIGRFPGPPE